MKDERGESERGGGGTEPGIRCGIAFALRFIGLPDRHARRCCCRLCSTFSLLFVVVGGANLLWALPK